jgi:putative DNA primase/helicase
MNSPADRIREALQFIPVGGHDERVRVAFMLKSELGEAGRDLWDEWRGDRGDDDAAPVWKSASETGKLKIGTLFHEAKSHGWQDDGTHRNPTAEEMAANRRDAAQRAAIEEAETAKQRADTAAKAAAIWKASRPASPENPYLVRKQVSPTATLREIDAGAAAAILGYAPKSNGEPLAGLLLGLTSEALCFAKNDSIAPSHLFRR